jgi:hypothetical protein
MSGWNFVSRMKEFLKKSIGKNEISTENEFRKPPISRPNWIERIGFNRKEKAAESSRSEKRVGEESYADSHKDLGLQSAELLEEFRKKMESLQETAKADLQQDLKALSKVELADDIFTVPDMPLDKSTISEDADRATTSRFKSISEKYSTKRAIALGILSLFIILALGIIYDLQNVHQESGYHQKPEPLIQNPILSSSSETDNNVACNDD